MRTERVEKMEKAVNSKYDAWRDRFFVTWGKHVDGKMLEDLEQWKKDFPEGKPRTIKVVLSRSLV